MDQACPVARGLCLGHARLSSLGLPACGVGGGDGGGSVRVYGVPRPWNTKYEATLWDLETLLALPWIWLDQSPASGICVTQTQRQEIPDGPDSLETPCLFYLFIMLATSHPV